MALTLLAGPANAGKVALLLDRYLADLPREPVLIVPTGSDVERVERDLLARAGALLGGSIGTFDDVFRRIAAGNGGAKPVAGDAQRALVLRRVVAEARLGELGDSARFSGFADALGSTIAELESGLLDPDDLDGDLAELYARYRTELDRLGLWDRDLQRRYAADRLAGERIEALPPRYAEVAHPVLAHLERALFQDAPPAAPAAEGAIRFLEGAGTRATLELVADEVLQLLRAGSAPEEILVVCPSLDRVRGPLEAAFGALAVPYALDATLRLSHTPLGHAMLSLLRFAWLGGGRRDLFGFVRSTYSGLPRAHADFLEGRLRGRGIRSPERVESETVKLRGQPLVFLDRLRAAPTSIAAARDGDREARPPRLPGGALAP